MDAKIFAAVLAVGLLGMVAFAGIGYAGGFWGGMRGPMADPSGNFTGSGMHEPGANCTGNAAGCGMRGPWGNGTLDAPPRMNETLMQEFRGAISSGDYDAAMQLHEEYGFGGQMFERLNETTFGQLSQIHNMRTQLMQELGMNDTPRGLGMGCPMRGHMGGMGHGRR
jgi:hypothetical protein